MSRRIVQLLVGLALYGVGCGLTIRAGWGVDPWTVFAEGISIHVGIGIGWITNILGALVLLLWIPLRQKPGMGTLANVALVGTAIQGTLAVVPAAPDQWTGAAVLLGGTVVVALASGIYLGAGFGAGPRDGLMTGLNRRLGWPIWLCRLLVESTVLALGWMLGGTVGIGTVVFALCIGPLVHRTLPLFDRARREEARIARAARGVSARGTRVVQLPASGAN